MINKIKKIIERNLKRGIEKDDIQKNEMEIMLKKGIIVLDVRSPQEYEEGHIDSAISIPEYEIKKKINEIIPNKEKEIIVYCSSGTRSKKAQKELKKLGYKKVYNLHNGVENY